MCQRDIPHLCDAKLAVGTGSLQGGFAEYVKVPERMVMDIPGEVTLRDAALVDTIAVGCHGISRVSFLPGEDGVIFGAGPIGLATLLVLKAGGARRIGVVEVNETRQGFAREFGADVVVSPRESGYQERLREAFSGAGPDVALECAGRVDAMKDALDTVRPGGRVALMGITFEALTILPISLTMREVSIFPTFSTRWADNEAALRFIQERREEARRLISDIIGIDELPRVFGELLAGALKKKVLIEFFRE
jgi:threonine dehydrogenase-like Zn-dependent dehydrogenase